MRALDAGGGGLVRAIAWAGRFKTERRWALPIALTCLAGVAYGTYYYLPQFAATPFLLWPLAPDTPLAVLWAALALALHWRGRARGRGGAGDGVGAAAIDALAFVGNFQVGLWTLHVLVVYADAFNTFAWDFTLLLLVSHAGMVLLSMIFLDGVRRRFEAAPRAQAWGVAVAAAFYLVQDAMDYFGPDFLGRGCGMRPHTVPCEPQREVALALVTFALTLASVALLVLLTRRGARAGEGET